MSFSLASINALLDSRDNIDIRLDPVHHSPQYTDLNMPRILKVPITWCWPRDTTYTPPHATSLGVFRPNNAVQLIALHSCMRLE
jgi:hypothetical protein